MIRKIKTISIIILSSFIVWYVWDISYSLQKGYKPDFETFTDYEYLFSDSILSMASTLDGSSWVQQSNILNGYHYPVGYYTYIWEFRDLKYFCMDSVDIKLDDGFNQIRIEKSQTLNTGGNNPIEVRQPLNFKGKITINLNHQATVWDRVNTDKYVGFTGLVGRVALNNEKDESQIVFHSYSGLKPALFIFYKGYDSFFLIMVRSKSGTGTISTNMLRAFNLH